MLYEKYYNKRFIVAVLICGLAVIGCVKKTQPQDVNRAINEENNTVLEQSVVPVVTPEQYQASLRLALQPFWQEQKIAETKDAVLALIAPAEYISLHFKVVVALETIEQGQKDSDQAQVEEGFEKFNDLAQQYSWLK